MKKKICVIGLGYVGLPLLVNLAKKYKVIGYDQNEKRIKQLKKLFDKNNEITKIELRNKNINLIHEHQKIKYSNFYIIAVPTPVNSIKKPDLKIINKATKIVAKYLKKNDIVVFESTVFPGYTRDIAVPILEKYSDLKFNIDFSCGYSPERINPGDTKHTIKNIIKVTSGSNKKALFEINEVYKSIVKAGIFPAKSIEVAEAAKVIENTQRDINIALINEFQVLFDKLNLSTHQILEAASTKWNFLNFKPGLVGGHCIGVDPYYLTYKAKQVGYMPKVILSGRNLNDSMSGYYAQRFVKKIILNKKKNYKILILGLTFKENCNDTRNSKIFEIAKKLAKKSIVDVFDPHVKKDDLFKFNNRIKFIKTISKNKYDGIFIGVKHTIFQKMGIKNIKKFGNKKCIIYDLKNMFNKKDNFI